MSAININKNNFENEVLNSDKTVLLDFWASWCAPCRRVVPIVEEIADERRDIKVGKINVDEEPELANKFSIMSIPTLISLRSSAISSTCLLYTSVLGLITTKNPELEDKDKVIARIHESEKYIPLERLCLSPQCGFCLLYTSRCV